jgi:dienelactone hydrolase
VTAVGLLRHALVAPATITVTLKNAAGTTLATVTPTVTAGPLVAALPATLTTVRSMTVAVASATGMSLGWVYAGVPFKTAHNAKCRLRRAYAVERGSARNASAGYLGQGWGGELAWENWLSPAEFDALLSLVDDCKADGDAPLVLVPHVLHPEDAALVRIDSDALNVSDLFDYQPNDAANRNLSLTLPLAPVFS